MSGWSVSLSVFSVLMSFLSVMSSVCVRSVGSLCSVSFVGLLHVSP